MRLINAQTFELELFTDPLPDSVPYAILSHVWSEDEVSYLDMQDLANAVTKKGFAKIQETCQTAINHGLLYAWVDTCCIDKSSSAELSEAINSMYRWYSKATVCYAYLSDLASETKIQGPDGLQACKWFTRGWTLQELIAPTKVMFFDREWMLRGTKIDLKEDLETITGISRWILTNDSDLSAVSLAKRMSWAADRQVTRIEDMAYCLLGIFDVNMPMIYGEGNRAFIRLQEEILKKTTDLSLLAWEQSSRCSKRSGILATSPAHFRGCRKVVLSNDQFQFRDEIIITNKGVKINASLQYTHDNVYVLDLHCYREEMDGTDKRLGIYLTRVLDSYNRHDSHTLAIAAPSPHDLPQSIVLAFASNAATIGSMTINDQRRRICVTFSPRTRNYRVDDVRAVPESFWEPHDRYFSLYGLTNFRCFVRFRVTSIPPLPNFLNSGSSKESTQFILVCELVSGQFRLRMNLYTKTGLHSSPRPERFIDPFKQIEQYGPLGDPFSLSVLMPENIEDHRVSIIHGDYGHKYVVSVTSTAAASMREQPGDQSTLGVKVRIAPTQPKHLRLPGGTAVPGHARNGRHAPGHGSRATRNSLTTSAAPLQWHPYLQ